MKWLTRFAVVLSIVGCGGGCTSFNGTNPTNPTSSIATGQWEFAFGDGNSPSLYIEANFSDNGAGVFSDTTSTFLLFPSQFFAPVYGGAIGSGICGNFVLGGSNSGTSFTGSFDSPGGSVSYTLSGTLAPDDKSISNGTEGGGSVACSQTVPSTFSAYLVPSISGTFTGTLSASNGVQDQAVIQISENASLQLTGSGTVTGNGVVTTITIPAPDSTSPSKVTGAVIEGTGSAANASGTDDFQFVARCNATASQIYVKTYDGHSGVSETGYLNKQ